MSGHAHAHSEVTLAVTSYHLVSAVFHCCKQLLFKLFVSTERANRDRDVKEYAQE